MLMTADIELEFARRFRNQAEDEFPGMISEVRIFGSRARGDARLDSDLDLFVKTTGEDRARRNRLCDIAWDIAYAMELPYPVVAHVMSDERFDRLLGLERRLARDIMSEGIAV